MEPVAGNLFAAFPETSEREVSVELMAARGLKIERIISTGQASPPGFWYDQGWSEWVLLVAGEAWLEFEGDAALRRLQAGDYVLIPAHCRHRVARTDNTAPTIWLAVHFGEPSECSPGADHCI